MPYTFNPFTGNFDYYQTGGGGVVASGSYKSRVVPTPSPDGSTTVFTMPDIYQTGSLSVYINGAFEEYVTELTSTTFSFNTAPLTGDLITGSYMVGLTTSGGQYKSRVAPTPAADGITTIFTTPDLYKANSLSVYINGVFEKHVVELSSTTFSFNTAPVTGDLITVSYMVGP